MVSTSTAPESRKGMYSPRRVMMGIRALRSACLKTTARSESPFARAVRMKSWWITSSIELRM
jgi:hypothetical protein